MFLVHISSHHLPKSNAFRFHPVVIKMLESFEKSEYQFDITLTYSKAPNILICHLVCHLIHWSQVWRIWVISREFLIKWRLSVESTCIYLVFFFLNYSFEDSLTLVQVGLVFTQLGICILFFSNVHLFVSWLCNPVYCLLTPNSKFIWRLTVQV